MWVCDEEIGSRRAKDDDIVLKYFRRHVAYLVSPVETSIFQLTIMTVERISRKETSATHSNDPVNGKCDEVQERPVGFVLCGVKMMSLHAKDISNGYWSGYSPVCFAIVGLQDPSRRSSETQSPSGREGRDGGRHPRALGN